MAGIILEILGCLSMLIVLATSAGIDRKESTSWDTVKQTKYLQKYGYMLGDWEQTGPNHVDKSQLATALKKFQKLWGLAETGTMNEETQNLMAQARCANSDFSLLDKSHIRRTKRYTVVPGLGWGKTFLTYRIRNFPANVDYNDAINAINRAFHEWSEISVLAFDRIESTPDIDILFAYGYHGDDVIFDGQDGTLAHAFFPIYGGDIHMDAAETWTIYTGQGTDLFQVLVHEIGHSLGLGHSNLSPVMKPFYTYLNPWSFSQDDRNGIEYLYGKQRNPEADEENEVDLPQDTEDIFCSNPKLDAITYGIQQDTYYVFQGNQMALLINYKIAPDYPQVIQARFPTIPFDIDAAVYVPDIYSVYCYRRWWRTYCVRQLYESKRFYFFKNSEFYYYDFYGNNGVGSLRSYPNFPTSIDAAFTEDGLSISFISGSMLYKITRGNSVLDYGYPIPLSSKIPGLPNQIDATLVTQNKLFVFSGRDYYRVTIGGMYQIDPSYPQEISSMWYGCNRQTATLQHDNEETGALQLHTLYINQNKNILHLNESEVNWITEEESNRINGAETKQCSILVYLVIQSIYMLYMHC